MGYQNLDGKGLFDITLPDTKSAPINYSFVVSKIQSHLML